MINIEEVLMMLVAELPLSEFIKSCKKAGISDEGMKFIADLITERGV